MIFSSLVFLSIFLPIVYVLYLILPSLKIRNCLLIIASLLFYAYGEPVYVFLMIFSVLFNYILARLISQTNYKKIMLTIDIVLNLGILCIFKYSEFLISNINSLLSVSIPIPAITLPIGISFFTFQALSYVIDVYTGKVEVENNLLNVMLYISFFPQLIAGPIVKYRDIATEISDRSITSQDAGEGLRRFIYGLSKKVLIANTLGLAADTIFSAPLGQINILTAWMGAIFYTLQIYYDFSGYSDMAIGLGRMFGFHFKENFLHPYGSATVTEFWRRWHVSLSTWFKEYVYIPLGGNRKGKLRTNINKFIVFFLCGLWHGASWTFVLWGLYHGFFLFVEDFIPAIKKLPKVVLHIYTLVVVTIGFTLFRADTLAQAGAFMQAMFTGFELTPAAMSLAWSVLTPWNIFILVVAILCCAPLQALANQFKDKLSRINVNYVKVMSYALSVCLLCWCILRLSGSAYNPFIYFRF